MSKKAKRKSRIKKHLGNKPHFIGLGQENLPQSQGFTPQDKKMTRRPDLRRTTSK